MKRKLLAIVLSSMMIFSLSACSVNEDKGSTSVPETETVTDTESTREEETEESSTVEESEQKETEESKPTEESETAEKETEESTEQTKEEKPTESAKKDTSSESTETKKPVESKPEESKPEPTPAPHTHNYSSSVTQNASCTANGVKTFTCSCGDSYTESIPTTDHNWVAQTEIIHHEATGHYEDQVTGYDEKKVVECRCGYKAYDNATWKQHEDACGSNATVKTEKTPITESVWVEDSQAWDETITTGHKCSVCGAVQ